MNTAGLLWSLLISGTGFVFFQYGRKQQRIVPLACGLALMIYPYFVSNALLMVGIGAALMAVPYFFRL